MNEEILPDFVPTKNPGDKLRRVLIIQFGPMRTFLEGVAASAFIRRTHRSAHITLLTEPRFLEFGKACPYFNDVEAPDQHTKAFVLKKLKSAKYQMLYDFDNSEESHSIAKTLKTKYESSTQKAVSHPYQPFAAYTHYTQHVADQLYCAGIPAIDGGKIERWPRDQRPKPDFTWIKAAFRNSPRLEPAFFNLYERFALVIPGGPIDETEKGWSPEKFGALCNKIHDAGVIPVIIGNSTQGSVAMKINTICEKAVNLISRADFFQMIALSQNATFFVGGETGPTYLAASTGLNGVALFRQSWAPENETDFSSVWDPITRLAQYAPKGGNIVVNNAENVEEIHPDDVWRSILALNVL